VLRGGAAAKCPVGGCAPGSKVTATTAAMRKAEKAADYGESLKPKQLSADSVRAIQDYRRTNTLTQAQFNMQCGFPANAINQIEARKVVPTPAQVQALNRILQTRMVIE
jgi:ribosome-binding protein aMBF1 (putative translation factor)